MPVIVPFGQIQNEVRPVKGDPFNLFWLDDTVLNPADIIPVTLPIPAGGPSYYLAGLYFTGEDCAAIELYRDNDLLWKGRNTAAQLGINPQFPDGEIVFAPGDTIVVKVYYESYSRGADPIEFSGNIFGYKR